MSIKIDCDIITVAPRHVDYPAYRKRLKELAPHFNKIHYLFNYHSAIPYAVNYSEMIRQDIPFCNFIDVDMVNTNASAHWYHATLTEAFKHCTSKYILILEPDFIFNVSEVIAAMSTFDRDVLTYSVRPTPSDCEGNKSFFRISPSFFMVRRSLASQTAQDFSEGMTDNYTDLDFREDGGTVLVRYPLEKLKLVDCFNKFTNDLWKLTTDICLLTDLGITNYFHYAGITHNFSLCSQGNFGGLHNTDNFVQYLKDNLDVPGVAYHPDYINNTHTYLAAIAAL